MKKIVIAVGLFMVTTFPSFSQCSEDDIEKVLLLGDSWAAFMNTDGTFNNVFDQWGHSNYSFYSNDLLAVNGARAEDFLVASRLNEIENQLVSKPNLKAVHVSLGGNDFLGTWDVGYSASDLVALSDETLSEIATLVDFIQGIRPDIQIVFSGYMYPNFEEIIEDAAPFQTSHPFYMTWEDMGFPTFEQLNTLLSDFSDRVEDEIAAVDDKISFINVPALMQRIYGQEDALGVDPGGSYAPLFQPLPYGDITYPSPKLAMRDYGLVRDCFHLSAQGYVDMIDYQFQKFYHKFMMDEAYIIAESTSENGAVSAGGIVHELILGEDTDLFRTVLSFNTTGIADTNIIGASIFLRRDTVIGTNPLGTTVNLRMIAGNFGDSPDLDASDFSDEGDIVEEACVFGSNEEDTDWVRIVLPESFLGLITNDNITQFSLGVASADERIIFTGIDDPEFAPVLNIDYQSDFVSINENASNSRLFMVYPNPAKEQLNILALDANASTTNIQRVEILNLQGQVVFQNQFMSNQINISELLPGNYFVRIITENGATINQFVKR